PRRGNGGARDLDPRRPRPAAGIRRGEPRRGGRAPPAVEGVPSRAEPEPRHAAAARRAAGGERGRRRGDRLLAAEGADLAGDARDPRRGREGRAVVPERRDPGSAEGGEVL